MKTKEGSNMNPEEFAQEQLEQITGGTVKRKCIHGLSLIDRSVCKECERYSNIYECDIGLPHNGTQPGLVEIV